MIVRATTDLTTHPLDPTFLTFPGALAFLALDDGLHVHGWCWGYRLPRPDGTAMLYLHHLEVTEPHRRQGIGHRLLQAFMDAGTQAGATKMFLITGTDNHAARHLYESLGGELATQGPTVNYWFQLTPAPEGE